jgi:hypothetical protein
VVFRPDWNAHGRAAPFRRNGENHTSYTRVGAAFPHKKGCGFNVEITEGISVSGQLVALPPRPREESQAS